MTTVKQESLQLTTGGKKENRRALDFYPTPNECTIALMEFLKLNKYSEIWEPACGNGAISEVIKGFNHRVYSTDLFDYGYGTSGVDYLNTFSNVYDAIITNPPFNLSTAFISKAVCEAPIVAMLLKSQYWHSKSRYNLFMDKPPAYILPLTWRPNFAPDKGSAPTMEVHWTVWIRGRKETHYLPLLKPCSF